MTAAEMAAVVGLGLTVVTAIVVTVLWVTGRLGALGEAITTSRHKTMNDLQPKFVDLDEDIEKLRDDVSALKRTAALLEQRVLMMEARRAV